MGGAAQQLLLVVNGKADGAKKALGEITGGLSATTKASAAMAGAMMAGGVLVGKAMGAATKATADYGSQVVQIQRMTGASAEESSKWAAILGRYGVEGSKAALVVKSLTVAIADQSTGLKSLGIATQKADGSNRSSSEVLADLAEHYKNAKDKTEILAVASKTLGRGFSSLLPVLAGGRQAIDDLGAAAERNGLILSSADLQAIKAYNGALKDNQDAMKGATVQVGLATLPWETWKTKALGGTLAELHKVNPELVKYGGAMADIGADVAKAGAGGGLFLAGLPSIVKGAAMVKGAIVSMGETIALKGMYAAEGLGGVGAAAAASAGPIALLTGGVLASARILQVEWTPALRDARDAQVKAGRAANTAALIHRTSAENMAVAARTYGASIKAVGHTAAWATPHAQGLNRTTADGIAICHDATVSTKNLTTAVIDLTKARGLSTKAARAATDAELGALNAAQDVTAKQKALAAAIKTYGKNSNQARIAELELLASRRALGDANRKLTKDQHAANEAFVRGEFGVKKLSGANQVLAHDLNVATDRVSSLRGQLEKVPANKRAKVEAQIAEAERNVNHIKGKIASITGKSVTVHVGFQGAGKVVESKTGHRIEQFIVTNNAAGTIAKQATLGIFGEASPRYGEYLINADRLARGDRRQMDLTRSLLTHAPGGGRGTGDIHVHVAENATFNVGDKYDSQRVSRDIAEFLERELRSKGFPNL